ERGSEAGRAGVAVDGKVHNFPFTAGNFPAEQESHHTLLFLDHQANVCWCTLRSKQPHVRVLIPQRGSSRVPGDLHHPRHIFAAGWTYADHGLPLDELKSSASERRM